jgi:hypothetical protein
MDVMKPLKRFPEGMSGRQEKDRVAREDQINDFGRRLALLASRSSCLENASSSSLYQGSDSLLKMWSKSLVAIPISANSHQQIKRPSTFKRWPGKDFAELKIDL